MPALDLPSAGRYTGQPVIALELDTEHSDALSGLSP